jgi:hypothetical protein
LAAAPDLGSGAVRRVGSSPITRTVYFFKRQTTEKEDVLPYIFFFLSPFLTDCVKNRRYIKV